MSPNAYDIAHHLAFGPLLFQAAHAARNLGLLDAMGRRDPTPEATLVEASGLSAYAVHVLLEALLAAGLAARSEAGGWTLTGAGAVVRADPRTRVNMDFVHDVCYLGAYSLEEALRTGTPAGLRVFGPWPTVYEGLAALPPEVRRSWDAFDHHYSDSAFPHALGHVFARKPARLLDVGCNTGRFAMLCAARHPDVRLTLLDHPQTVSVALANLAGFGDRIVGHGVDLLDAGVPFPTGFDAVWMSQLLDCFGPDALRSLLARGRAALAPDGRLYVLEPCTDRQTNEVARDCLYATSLYFTAIANGTSRMYGADELVALAGEAGLTLDTEHAVGGGHTLLVFRA